MENAIGQEKTCSPRPPAGRPIRLPAEVLYGAGMSWRLGARSGWTGGGERQWLWLETKKSEGTRDDGARGGEACFIERAAANLRYTRPVFFFRREVWCGGGGGDGAG